jgi:hypothetical protein
VLCEMRWWCRSTVRLTCSGCSTALQRRVGAVCQLQMCHPAGFVPWLAAAAAAAAVAALHAEAQAAAALPAPPSTPSGAARAAMDAVDALTALVRPYHGVMRPLHVAVSDRPQPSSLPCHAAALYPGDPLSASYIAVAGTVHHLT